MHRAGATLVESREQLEGLQRDHPVLFLLVHDSKEDTDWQQVYLKVGGEFPHWYDLILRPMHR